MALVRKFKKLSLFITMTCNPTWPEITRHLCSGQTALDRPDLVCRVFKIELDDLNKAQVLGPSLGFTYSIVFQKRGLPHAHILLILQDQPKTPEDKIIKAVIPDARARPALHKAVTSHMLHGPCGLFDTSAPCMQDKQRCKNGRCCKEFRYEYSDRTTMKEGQRPLYARPQQDPSRSFVKKGVPLDNRDVVPYNPYLLCKYDCHINVEIATSVHAIKYINKYIHKGSDGARRLP